MMIAEKNPPEGGFRVSVQIVDKDEGLAVFILEHRFYLTPGPHNLAFVQIQDLTRYAHVIRRFNCEQQAVQAIHFPLDGLFAHRFILEEYK